MLFTPQIDAAWPAPMLRRPCGGYRANFAAAIAFSTVSTVGTTMPRAPMSVAFWMLLSNSSGTRMTGVAIGRGHAAIISSTSRYDIVLCCISNQM